jgi:HAE1 family hydrophobic/amphiphilic exporter-1
MVSRFFIERPILANVIAILIVFFGALAVLRLPVAQYPDITPPTVQVTASYPGASARIVADTVALPIEQQVNGVQDMLYMQSTSASDGTYQLVVTFKVGTNLDMAQVLVQNRVATAIPQLPDDVQKQGALTKKVSTAILQIICLFSPNGKFDSLFLSNYAWIYLRDVLSRLPGVGDVAIQGVGEYSMRVWLDAELLKNVDLNPSDIVNAIQQQNQPVPAGQVGMPPAPISQNFQFPISVAGRLEEVEQFENIIVKKTTGKAARIVRIKDIGRVELGAQTYSQFSNFDGQPGVSISVYQLPGANALQVADEVAKTMAELSKSFPHGMSYAIPFDTTQFTRDSIQEVYHTLFEAAALVLFVIMLFLQNWRATLVPATTVPVTIIGAFIAMAVMGFTVNMVTLFALILAIGIVVDDAIVIVEGAARGIEKGLAPKQAAIMAMDELTGPVLGITFVLMAVFLPAAFLPGITGQLYRQFALVIAATAVISAVNALTLKPVQCSQYLKPRGDRLNAFYRGFNHVYDKFEKVYIQLVRWVVTHSGVMMAMYALIMFATFYGFRSIPTGFIPDEDQGYALVGIQLPDAASIERTGKVTAEVEKTLRETPGIAHLITIGGISLLDNSASLPNGAVIYIMYEDFEKRSKAGLSQAKILGRVRGKLSAVQDAVVFAVVPPAIQGLGVSGGFQMMLELRGSGFNFTRLGQMADELIQEGNTQPGLAGLSTSIRPGYPQVEAAVDRVKAENVNVPLGDAFNSLQSYLGSYYVNQFNKYGRTYQVYVQADSRFREKPEDIRRLYVRNTRNEMVPLGTLTDVRLKTGPPVITLYNLYPAAPINGMAGAGYSSGQALQIMEDIATQKLPADMAFEWTGMSFQEKLVGRQTIYVFTLAALIVFLVLAAQYESWTDPAAVILVVPLAMFGTVLALSVCHYENNVYTQIGIVLLIALAAKNAILVVEHGRELLANGMPVLEAAVEASRRRLRPILMTSFAFILGVIPLATAKGAGYASQQALGTAVIGGMLASTLIAILFVPVYYVLMVRVGQWFKSRNGKKPERVASSKGTG